MNPLDHSHAIVNPTEDAIPHIWVEQVAILAPDLVFDAGEDGLQLGKGFLDVFEVGFGRAAFPYKFADGKRDGRNCLDGRETGRRDAERVRHGGIRCMSIGVELRKLKVARGLSFLSSLSCRHASPQLLHKRRGSHMYEGTYLSGSFSSMSIRLSKAPPAFHPVKKI